MGADQYLAGSRGLLQARREGDRFAGGKGRVALVDDDLPRFDAHPGLEPDLADRVEHRERGANGALGVVLVCLGNAKSGQDCIAGEFLDDAAVRRHAMRDPLEELRHSPACDFRICSGDERRRIDQVDEQNGCQLSLHHGLSL